ncbi:hypothetical protein CIP107532_01980 [Corynebacterium diphtheriae]|nr:hypothetical protein CIP107532_01980 [Corynebacterium diphtheriae]CAB0660674.1 hypothetical protein CIP107562_01802 [Corynebacterium diphtheriae]CAB0824316.1 hypothetical protein FRC0290_01776 [Corynebacterium diphtheriae]
MTWMTKNLTLDLLAITINYGQQIFDRIRQEPEDPWKHDTPWDQHPTITQTPPTNPTPQPTQEETEKLHTQAQKLLRDISLAGDMEWITGTLFPQLGVTSLNDVPPTDLPHLIKTAQQHQETK